MNDVSESERESSVENDEPVPPLTRVVQVILIILGLAGSLLHAFPLAIREEHQNWPDIDFVGLAWLALVAVSPWIPNIEEIAVGGFSVKTRRLAKATRTYDEVVVDLARLAQRWSTSAASYVRAFEQDESTALVSRDELFANYVDDRMAEAYQIISPEVDVQTRVAIWFYDFERREIVFGKGLATGGTSMVPTKASWMPGEGMIGRCFLDQRAVSAADVRTVPSYVTTRNGGDPPYLAVLCQPMIWGADVLGVVTADRSTAGLFGEQAEQIVEGFAAHGALAYQLYRRHLGTSGA